LLARRDEEAGFPPRPSYAGYRSNEASNQKGRNPMGRLSPRSGEAAISKPENNEDFPLWGFSTVS